MTTGRPGRRGLRATILVMFIATAPKSVMRLIRQRMQTPIEEVVVTGRRSGVERHLLLTLAEVDGRWYVAHPDYATTQWIQNLLASPDATVVRLAGDRTRVRAAPVAAGAERDAAVAELIRVQRGPARLVYRSARRHVEEHAQVFRLDPIPA